MCSKHLFGSDLIEEGHHKLEHLREISSDEFVKYERASGFIGLFNSSYSLFEICQINYNDIEVLYSQLANQKGISTSTSHSIIIDVNQRIINYLTSFRMFNDHQETTFKRRYGETSEEYEDFKIRTSYHYDYNFSYRFLWKLRDFVQHCGFPLGGYLLENETKGKTDTPLQVSLWFNRNNLLSEFHKWGVVKNDLEKQPEKMELLPHANQLICCLQDLALFVARRLINENQEHWNFITELVNEVYEANPNFLPCIGDMNKDGKLIGFVPLPTPTYWKINQIILNNQMIVE